MNQFYTLFLVLCSAFNPETSTFLIYNRSKCLKAVSATVVQTASCNVSSKAQHFRWISSSQIMSLSFNFCLGSEKISNWAKITLLPCNDHSPVQTWECKDESLFGLKGHPLHLNYGNKKDNVVLYTGTGDLSRWQIYETKRNLCSGYQVVPVPNITVFRQMEDRERVMVMCSFGKRLNESTFHLLLEGEHNYTQNNPLCYSSEKCVFEVKDSPPVSLICEHKIHSVESHQSETYIYSASGVAEEEGISLFYICFSSFIAVGLLIMIAAVVVTTIMSKTKRFNEYCDR